MPPLESAAAIRGGHRLAAASKMAAAHTPMMALPMSGK